MEIPVLEFQNPTFTVGWNLTVRRGTRWHQVTPVRLRLYGGALSSPVHLLSEVRQFQSLTESDLADEHDPACRTPAGLLNIMRRSYDGFATTEYVTLCRFYVEGDEVAVSHPE